jgi:tRNA(Ile)-lysidine synthase
MAERWSPDHLRLHRRLLRDPTLLPSGATVLVAVSGGQDSMALLALLLDLQRLHHWPLRLWHGNHNWRPEAGEQARQLAAWAAGQGLPIRVDTWAEPAHGEAAARAWRYGALARAGRQLGAQRVATAHTASDRAETLLLNLARGSHRRGLASLAVRRRLADVGPEQSRLNSGEAGEPELARPLLEFSRADTARICTALGLPVWVDPSNQDPRFSRNRVRREVVPVLEELHPGAERRISALAQRLAEEESSRGELLELALQAVLAEQPDALRLPALLACSPAIQRDLIQHWLRHRMGEALPAGQLETLLARLKPPKEANSDGSAAPGEMHLIGGWRLRWHRCTLMLNQEPSAR